MSTSDVFLSHETGGRGQRPLAKQLSGSCGRLSVEQDHMDLMTCKMHMEIRKLVYVHLGVGGSSLEFM